VNNRKFPPTSIRRKAPKAEAFPAYPFSPPASEAVSPPTPDELPVADVADPGPTDGESAEALGLSEADYQAEVSDEEFQRHPLSPDDNDR